MFQVEISWYMYQLLGLYSLSGKTSYRKISWSLEAVRFGFKLFQSLWNLEGTSAALLPRCLSNFRAIRPSLQHPISRLRDFTRFGGKTPYRLVNRGPEWWRVDTSQGIVERIVADLLTHWGRDKMTAIFQTTSSNGFSWMKMYEFRLRLHWNLFPRVQLTKFQHWFR